MNVTVLTIDSATKLPPEARWGRDRRWTVHLQDGTISAVNRPAYRLGVRVDEAALALARRVAEKSF